MVVSVKSLSPGSSVGVVGGGQLGRYFVLAARQAGYITWVLDPDKDAPAAACADQVICAEYSDRQALRQLGEACDAVTIEFENVPAYSLRILDELTQLAPKVDSVEIAQDRLLEKKYATQCGLQTAPYKPIFSLRDCEGLEEIIQFPAILKLSRLGYDGKGQIICQNQLEVREAFSVLGQVPCILEQRVDLASELSVVLARGFDGSLATFPVAENQHRSGILHLSTVPPITSTAQVAGVIDQASKLAAHLDYVGVLGVEFFISSNGEIYFNEMAPRPHNTGHYTLDATVASQFEQQLRVLCAQPLASVRLLSSAVMVNLLGDLWSVQDPAFECLLSDDQCRLHLYGKKEARARRKMGHFTTLDANVQIAHDRALQCYERLVKYSSP